MAKRTSPSATSASKTTERRKTYDEAFANLGFAGRYNKNKKPGSPYLGVQTDEKMGRGGRGIEIPRARVKGVTVRPRKGGK